MVYSFKKVDKKIIKKINNYYQNFQIITNNPHTLAVYQKKGVTITIFKNYSVIFQGNNLEPEVLLFFTINSSEKTTYTDNFHYYDIIIGNDEVGVGDIFGPLIVTSCIPLNHKLNVLQKLDIRDSKKIKNSEIVFLTEKILPLVQYATIIINNEQYNQLYQKYQNTHIIKALGHNQALVKLFSNYPNLHHTAIYIDQFASKTNYLNYLKNEPNIINEHLNFVTQGESKYLAIACSAIISRYYFLQEINSLSQFWHLNFPLGASNQVKLLAQSYFDKYGEKKCNSFMKLHFNRVV